MKTEQRGKGQVDSFQKEENWWRLLSWTSKMEHRGDKVEMGQK